MASNWMDLYAPLIAAQGTPHTVTPQGGRNMAIAESKTERVDPWTALLGSLIKEGADYFAKDFADQARGTDLKKAIAAMGKGGYEPSALPTGTIDKNDLIKLIMAQSGGGGNWNQ